MNIMLNNSDCEGFLKVYKDAKLVVGHNDFLNYWDKHGWTLAAVLNHTLYSYSEHATLISNLTHIMDLFHCIKL